MTAIVFRGLRPDIAGGVVAECKHVPRVGETVTLPPGVGAEATRYCVVGVHCDYGRAEWNSELMVQLMVQVQVEEIGLLESAERYAEPLPTNVYLYRDELYCEPCGIVMRQRVRCSPGFSPSSRELRQQDCFPQGPHVYSETDWSRILHCGAAPKECVKCGWSFTGST